MTPPRRVVSIHGPHPLSGVSTWIGRLLRSTATRHDWHVLLMGDARDLATMKPFPGQDTGRITARAWNAEGLAVVDRVDAVRSALDELEPDVVIPNYLPEAYAAAGLSSNNTRVLGVCHSRDFWYLELFQQAGPLMDAAWVVSSECHRLVEGTLRPGSPIADAPYGVELPRTVTTPPPDRPAGVIRLLYSGRLESPQKRCLTLADLADALHARGVPFELTIAGDGPDAPTLRDRLAEHLARGRAHMPGSIPNEQILQLVKAHDALVLVSAYEGTPLAGLEAMSMGRAVFVTDGCGGVTDAVRARGGGAVTPFGDIDAMADRIQAYQADRPRLLREGDLARQAAQELFGIDDHVAMLENLVDRALTDARVPGDPGRAVEAWNASGACVSLAMGGWPEHVNEASVLRWRREWAASVGLPETDFEGRLPEIERLGSALLAGAVDELVTEGHARIAVFPAGRHSTRFGHVLRDRAGVACFVDDNATDATPPLHDHPVLTPRAALDAGIDAIVVSSDQYEAALEARARTWAGDLPIRTLYVPVRIPSRV